MAHIFVLKNPFQAYVCLKSTTNKIVNGSEKSNQDDEESIMKAVENKKKKQWTKNA